MSVNEVKITQAPFEFEVRGTGDPGARTFAIGDEDHTIGNPLRHVMMQSAKVDFCGYSVPHPSEPVVHIRVQTAKHSTEPRQSAVSALKEACVTLNSQCQHVIDQLEQLIPETKEDRIHIQELIEREEEEMRQEDERMNAMMDVDDEMDD